MRVREEVGGLGFAGCGRVMSGFGWVCVPSGRFVVVFATRLRSGSEERKKVRGSNSFIGKRSSSESKAENWHSSLSVYMSVSGKKDYLVNNCA